MNKNIIVGICLNENWLEWTAARGKKDDIELIEHRAVTIRSALDETEVPKSIKQAYTGPQGQFWTALASDQALLRVEDLPTVDPTEIEGMIELQVDKFSPFPVEEMVVSFETLASDDKYTRVIIVAVQRVLIEELGDTFEAAGLTLSGVDISLLCRLRLLQDLSKTKHNGCQAFIFILRNKAELLVLKDNQPIALRSLGQFRMLDNDEEQDELVDELSYSLTSLETEWGGVELTTVEVWFAGSLPEGLATKLRDNCGLETHSHEIRELPPLSEGLARHAFSRVNNSMTNLALPEWAEKQEKQRLRKLFIIASAIFLAVWLVVVLVFFSFCNIQNSKADNLRAEAAKYRDDAAELALLEEKIQSLSRYADRSHSALECLREVCVAMPNGVDMQAWSFKKNKAVSVRGEADSADAVYDFIAALQESALFDKVEPEGVTSKKIRGKIRTVYRISIDLPKDEI